MNNSSFLEVEVELLNPKAGLKTLSGFELPLDRKLDLWGTVNSVEKSTLLPHVLLLADLTLKCILTVINIIHVQS